MKTKKALIVLGPPGAGKTTLVRAMLDTGTLRGKIAYFFNDEGTMEASDGKVIEENGSNKSAEFIPMMEGCFGCSDAESLHREITIATKRKFDHFVFEPLGFIEGSELPTLLKKCGIRSEVFTLLDVAHFKDNLPLGVMPSQLGAATLGIGLTKYGRRIRSIDSPALDTAVDYVAHHTNGQPIFLIPRNGTLPDEALSEFLDQEHHGHHHEEKRLHEHGHCECGHDHRHHDHHGHDHDHEHGHAHKHDGTGNIIHGQHTYHFPLKETTTVAQVRSLLKAPIPHIIRVKGTADRQQFQKVHGTWEETVRDSVNQPFVTMYATEQIDTSFLNGIIEVVKNKFEPMVKVAGTKELLQSEQGATPEESNALVRRLLKQVPCTVINTRYGPITNPELHELLNEVRKRPGIDPDLNDQAIRARVQYYLSAVREFFPEERWYEKPVAHTRRFAEKKRHLAVGIGWFAWNKPEVLGEEMMSGIRKIDLASLLSDGLHMLAHNSDREKALDFADEVHDVVRFIGRFDPRLHAALDYCQTIAHDDPLLRKKWREIVKTHYQWATPAERRQLSDKSQQSK